MNNSTYGGIEEDVSLEPEDKIKAGVQNQEWLKMTKGQVLLCSFLYFHSVDVNAVKAARAAAKAAGRPPTPEEAKSAAARALEDRAKELNKTVSQLSHDERLDLTYAQFKSFRAHYEQGLGFVLSRLGRDGAEADATWKRLPEAKQYFSTLLLLYPITREGRHDVDGLKGGRWRLVPWRFGRGVYGDIWALNEGLRSNGMAISHQDLRLECTDATYQSIKVSFVGKAVWQTEQSLRKAILTAAMDLYGSLIPFREMTTDQLRTKLGVASVPVQDVTSGYDPTGLLDV